MENVHSLLKRQLKRCFGDADSIPAASREFVDAVNDAYRAFDGDREMLERARECFAQAREVLRLPPPSTFLGEPKSARSGKQDRSQRPRPA